MVNTRILFRRIQQLILGLTIHDESQVDRSAMDGPTMDQRWINDRSQMDQRWINDKRRVKVV